MLMVAHSYHLFIIGGGLGRGLGGQLAQGCTTGSERGTEASPFPLGGSRLEDLLGWVSSWRERVGERRLQDMRLRLVVVVVAAYGLNVTGSI